MKLFKNFITSLIAATFVAGIAACSNDTGTASVLTETESGKTANADSSEYKNRMLVKGIVSDESGRSVTLARVYLTGLDTGSRHAFVQDSTLTDEDGRYAFDTKRKSLSDDEDNSYRILVKAPDGKDSLMGYREIFNYGYSKRTDSLDMDVTIGKPATIVLYTDNSSMLNENGKHADSVCFGGNFVCAEITEKDYDNGFITIGNVPAGTIMDYFVWYGKDILEGRLTRDIKPGETFHWAYGIGGATADSIEMKLPEATLEMMDSLGLSPALESVIAPFQVPDKSKNHFHSLMDGRGIEIPLAKAEGETDTLRYWGRIANIDDKKQTLRYLRNGYISTDHPTIPGVAHMVANAETGLSFKDSLFETRHGVGRVCTRITYPIAGSEEECDTTGTYTESDSTVGISFWFEADGSGSGTPLITAGSEEAGFKIAQCEEDPQFICTQIFSGDETKDATLYGKAKALDGKRHHVSFVIYGKHLAIAIDGKTVHSTDLKLGSKFYEGFAGITVGEFELKDLFIFEPKTLVKNPEEKGWSRLSAWLNAFYEMQK